MLADFDVTVPVDQVQFTKFQKSESLQQFLATRTAFHGEFSKAYAHHGVSKSYFNKPDKDYQQISKSADKAELNYDTMRRALQAADDKVAGTLKKVSGWKQTADPLALQGQAVHDLGCLADAKLHFEETKISLKQIKKELTKEHVSEYRRDYNRISSISTKLKENDVSEELARVLATDMIAKLDEVAHTILGLFRFWVWYIKPGHLIYE